jgi:hypothetical protein
MISLLWNFTKLWHFIILQPQALVMLHDLFALT